VPAWSWGSINGIIAHTTYFATGRMPPYVTEVVSCEVVPTTADPYSMVSTGTLICAAPPNRSRPGVFAWMSMASLGYSTGRCSWGLAISILRTKRLSAQALCCLLVCTKVYHHALLLQRIGESPDVYERVGLVVSSGDEEKAWWGDAGHQTFTIVDNASLLCKRSIATTLG
jgi:hypothetical protein